MSNTNIIELNGKRYDAISGHLLDNISPQTKPHKTPGRALDGILRKTASPNTSTQPQTPPHTHTSSSLAHSGQPSAATKHPLRHVAVHQPEHAKTLMRSAVKKPSQPLKAVTHIQAPLSHTALPVTSKLPSLHSNVDAERLDRAQQIIKSNAVSRFSESNHGMFVKHMQPLTVQTAPRPTSHHTEHQPLSAFETAIAQSTSHQEAAPHIAKRSYFKSRTVNVIAAGAALLLIAGFFTYQNIPNIDVRLASSRAGFQATLPGFKPSGFGFSGPVKYNPGEVTIGFRSNSDSRNFSIIEHASNWDSQTLLSDFVTSTGQAYQTVQNAGRTIYLYGSGNATWVNANVWYRVTGNSSLSTSQLVNIAASM